MEAIQAQLTSMCQVLVESGAFEKADIESAYKEAQIVVAVKYALWGAAKD